MNLEEKLLISLSSVAIVIIVVYSIYDYMKKRKITLKNFDIFEEKEYPKKKEKKPIGKIRRQGSLRRVSPV